MKTLHEKLQFYNNSLRTETHISDPHFRNDLNPQPRKSPFKWKQVPEITKQCHQFDENQKQLTKLSPKVRIDREQFKQITKFIPIIQKKYSPLQKFMKQQEMKQQEKAKSSVQFQKNLLQNLQKEQKQELESNFGFSEQYKERQKRIKEIEETLNGQE